MRIEKVFSNLDELRKYEIAVIGLGSLGTHLIANLCAFPFRKIILIDRDFVDEGNLETSLFFKKKDVNEISKVDSVKREIEKNFSGEIDAICDDLNGKNVERYLKDVDLIMDATDNLETRFLINEFAVKYEKVWVFSAVIGERGMSSIFSPGNPCFKCLVKDFPVNVETCEIGGLIPQISSLIASRSSYIAIRYLLDGKLDEGLFYADLRENRFEILRFRKRENCEVCSEGKFRFLGKKGSVISLCGEGKYQILPLRKINFDEIKEKIIENFDVKEGKNLIFIKMNGIQITLFRDGRAIIYNVRDEKEAKSVYSRIIGT